MKPADTRISPKTQVRLSDWDADDTDIIGKPKSDARARLDEYRVRLETLQELLYAEGKNKLLVVLQAMDTAGKDSTIRHVFQGVDPLGVRVAGFKAPTPYELGRDYLWRVHHHVPGTGEIAIFNRSHYEDVLITRVNGWIGAAECRRRYRQINDFERMLAETGTTILKFYLHISRDEQKKRLEERRDNPEKQWKFHPGDLAVRAQWDGCLRSCDVGHQHGACALARDPRQQQAGAQPDDFTPADRVAGRSEDALSGAGGRDFRHRDCLKVYLTSVRAVSLSCARGG
ncbi:MAG: PPK2 family polyphosphate kinase, partial [Thiobacillus sp.]